MSKENIILWDYSLKHDTWKDRYIFGVKGIEVEEKPKTYKTVKNKYFSNYNKVISKDNVGKVVEDKFLKMYVSLNPSKDIALQALFDSEKQRITDELDNLEKVKYRLTKRLTAIDNNEYEVKE